MLERISWMTLLSHPGRAVSGRFLQTSQTEDARDAELRARPLLLISVWIGHEEVATKPARIMEVTSVSQASGCLCANTITKRPSSDRESNAALNESLIRRSY